MNTSGLSEEMQRLTRSIGINMAKLNSIDERVRIVKGKIEFNFKDALSRLDPKDKYYNKKRIRLNLKKEKRLSISNKYRKTAKINLTNKIAELKNKLQSEIIKNTRLPNPKDMLNSLSNQKNKIKKMSGTKKTLIASLIAGIMTSAYIMTKKAEKKRNEELRKRR